MKNVNQRRKYSHIKWKGVGNKETRFAIGTALHTATDQFKEHLAGTLKTGGEIDLVSIDRDELRKKIVERNRRTLDKFYNAAKKTEGFNEMMERLNKISLNRPEESSKSDG